MTRCRRPGTIEPLPPMLTPGPQALGRSVTDGRPREHSHD